MWVGHRELQNHLTGKKHRRSLRTPLQTNPEPLGETAGAIAYVRVRADEQQAPLVVIPVYDAGGTEVGGVEAGPKPSWREMAVSWYRETGTRLLPPHGTCASTVAEDLRDQTLISLVLEA